MGAENLYVGQPGTSSAEVYPSDNTRTTITAATVTDVTAGPETLDVWIVPSGGSATNANKIYDGLSISANTAVGLEMLVGHTLEKGDSIHMSASTAATLTVRISGETHS